MSLDILNGDIVDGSGSGLTGVTDIYAKTTANTGIISGGALSINADPTKFDVSAGKGFIIDHSVSPPTTTIVEWTAFTAQVVTNLATSFATDIAINSSGAIVQQNSFTNTELRGLIQLGGLDHSNQTNIIRTFEIQVPSEAVGSSLKELSKAIGDINISGNIFSANGANLKLNKSAGTAFKFGSNNVTAPNDPHTSSQALLIQANFSHVFNDGAGNGVFQALTTDINPANYDDGSGTLATVTGNSYTIQRILLFANGNSVFVQYGTETYTTLASAVSGLSAQNFASLSGIRTAIVRGYLIVKANATALNNSSQALFVNADRFGGIGARDGGGGVIEWGNIVGTLTNQTDLVTALKQGVHYPFAQSGDYINQAINASTKVTTSVTANRLDLAPFFPSQDFEISTFSIYCSTAVASALYRVLVYSDLNGLPNIKLVESTDLDCSTIGLKSYASTYNFQRGVKYWVGVNNSSTATIHALGVGAMLPIKTNESLTSNSTFIRSVATLGSAPTTYISGTLISGTSFGQVLMLIA